MNAVYWFSKTVDLYGRVKEGNPPFAKVNLTLSSLFTMCLAACCFPGVSHVSVSRHATVIEVSGTWAALTGAACTSLQICTECLNRHGLMRVLWRCKDFVIGQQADIDPKVICGTWSPPPGFTYR